MGNNADKPVEYMGCDWKDGRVWIFKQIGKKEVRELYKEPVDEEEIYLTHDNGGRSFMVSIKQHKIKIYKHAAYGEETEEPFSEHIIIDSYIKAYVGKSPLNEMTKFSGGDGPDFDGNSILVHTHDNKYVYIGSEIYEFEMDDTVIKYVSPVGNNDVPYPYIVGVESTYLMLDQVIIPNKYIVLADPYNNYYFNMPAHIKKNIKRLSNVKVLQQRL